MTSGVPYSRGVCVTVGTWFPNIHYLCCSPKNQFDFSPCSSQSPIPSVPLLTVSVAALPGLSHSELLFPSSKPALHQLYDSPLLWHDSILTPISQHPTSPEMASSSYDASSCSVARFDPSNAPTNADVDGIAVSVASKSWLCCKRLPWVLS